MFWPSPRLAPASWTRCGSSNGSTMQACRRYSATRRPLIPLRSAQVAPNARSVAMTRVSAHSFLRFATQTREIPGRHALATSSARSLACAWRRAHRFHQPFGATRSRTPRSSAQATLHAHFASSSFANAPTRSEVRGVVLARWTNVLFVSGDCTKN